MSDAVIIYKATLKMLSNIVPGAIIVGICFLIAILGGKINERNRVSRYKPKRKVSWMLYVQTSGENGPQDRYTNKVC